MILRPAEQDLKTTIERLETLETIGFQADEAYFFDSNENYTAPSIDMGVLWRTYAKGDVTKGHYKGPLWMVEHVILIPKPGAFDNMTGVIDTITADDVVGTPSRVEGWKRWNENHLQGQWGKLRLRYDFLPEQLPWLNTLPSLKKEPRDIPYIVKFEVVEPMYTDADTLFGDLGDRVKLLLYPPQKYYGDQQRTHADNLGLTLKPIE